MTLTPHPYGLMQAAGEEVFSPNSISGCVLWLDAANRGSATNQWDDRSGNGNHFTSPGSTEFPSFSGGVATFNGTDDYLVGPTFESLTAAEQFILLKRYADNSETGSNTGGFTFGSAVGGRQHYTYSATIYTSFFRGSRESVNPPDNLAEYHILNQRSSASEWGLYINGVQRITASADFEALIAVPSYIGNTLASVVYKFQGDIKSLILYNKILSGSERTQINDYLDTL